MIKINFSETSFNSCKSYDIYINDIYHLFVIKIKQHVKRWGIYKYMIFLYIFSTFYSHLICDANSIT